MRGHPADGPTPAEKKLKFPKLLPIVELQESLAEGTGYENRCESAATAGGKQ
jgi:hypothetical protein